MNFIVKFQLYGMANKKNTLWRWNQKKPNYFASWPKTGVGEGECTHIWKYDADGTVYT